MKPIAMKCTQEEFDKIRPILEKNGKYQIIDVDSFVKFPYLVNNYGGLYRVSNVSIIHETHNRTHFHEWDQNTFLEYCDIDTIPEPTFKVGDTVTYKDQKDCGGDYNWGGEDFGGFKGMVTDIGDYQSKHQCYSIDVSVPIGGSYTMLESEFVEYDNQKSNTIKKMKKTDCTVKELLSIVDIACESWKPKLYDYMRRVDTTGKIQFSEDEVQEMFDAATVEQTRTLLEIFPKIKEIDFSKIKTGSVVKIKHSGQHVDGKSNINFSNPVRVVLFKTKELITSNSEFKIGIGHDSYCTFYQDGYYISYCSDDVIDYIVDVIKY